MIHVDASWQFCGLQVVRLENEFIYGRVLATLFEKTISVWSGKSFNNLKYQYANLGPKTNSRRRGLTYPRIAQSLIRGTRMTSRQVASTCGRAPLIAQTGSLT